jgi:hypothetical protein
MLRRIQGAFLAIETALAAGQQHLCLTDPDAQMMPEGRSKRVAPCHSWEVAVDRDAAVLVAGHATQSSTDNSRLLPLVGAAQSNEPAGVRAVDADSGYYAGDAVGQLLTAGIDVCVPDCNTACDLHRGDPIGTQRDRQRGQVLLLYDPVADCFRCPEGNELRARQSGHATHGQRTKDYRAIRSCAGCPRAAGCLTQPGAQYRTRKVGQYHALLEAARQRFNEAEHQERYRHRGEAVETVFGFVRGVLGYTRWLLRGVERVACEERLVRLAYQLRKVHGRWAQAAGCA